MIDMVLMQKKLDLYTLQADKPASYYSTIINCLSFSKTSLKTEQCFSNEI